MFVIGLEFNLPKLQSMRQLVFGLGLSQVVLTMFAAVAGNAALIVGRDRERPRLGPRLAERARARRSAGDELDRDRRQDDGRPARARERARPARDGGAAVPGSRRGAAAGPHSGARLEPGGAAARARGRGAQGDRAARRAARRRPRGDALVADAGRAQEERGAVHPQPAPGHARPGLADPARRPVARARRLRRRHADRRDRVQAPGRDRHPAVPRRPARPLLHHRRHASSTRRC